MDDATIKFITGQNKELKEDLKEFINVNGTLVRATMKAEIDRIDEMNEVRNGRIAKTEYMIKQTRKETGVFRWMHRNPGKAIAAIVILFGGLAYGYHKVDIKKSFEKKSGIYFKDTTTHSAERKPIQ